MTVYTIRKKKDSEEHHIFEAEWIPDSDPRSCSSDLKSICQKLGRGHSAAIGANTNCMTEGKARREAATLGRVVCGICVSHLYATPD